MDWCRQHKPLPKWMLPKNLLLVCVTRPQWIILFTNPIRLRPQGRVSWTTGMPPGQYAQEFCSRGISTYLIRKPPSGRGTVPRICRQWSISPDCDLAQQMFWRIYKKPIWLYGYYVFMVEATHVPRQLADEGFISVPGKSVCRKGSPSTPQPIPFPTKSEKYAPVSIQWFRIPPTNL